MVAVLREQTVAGRDTEPLACLRVLGCSGARVSAGFRSQDIDRVRNHLCVVWECFLRVRCARD